jgi:hypothetical protein
MARWFCLSIKGILVFPFIGLFLIPDVAIITGIPMKVETFPKVMFL